MRPIGWLGALLALVVVGCSDESEIDPPPDDDDDVEAELWPGEDERPELDHPFFAEHPALEDLSLYAAHVEGDDRPDAQHRGAFSLGNGRIFSLLGLTDPLNTLHSMVGPVYEKDGFFFSDVAVGLEVDGQEAAFDQEWIARVRGTAVVVTRADSATHSLYTVDFAARPAGDADLDVPPAIVRVMLVTGLAGAAGDVAVRLRPYGTPEVQDGMLVEPLTSEDRYRAYLPWDGDLQADATGHAVSLGSVAEGSSAQAVLVIATGETTADLAAVDARLQAADPGDWLEQTLSWWQTFSDRGVQIEVADERIEDLYDGMRVGIRVQQSAAGAVCPMSRYTGVWLRDTIGLVRFFLRSGLHDEARAALDYLFLCAAVEGDLSNHCSSGLHPDDLQGEPDWDSLGTWSGRLAAEGPSYVPLMYRDFTAFTGDWDPVEDRWPYLRRTLVAQTVEQDGLQPFSGDETFRVAMSAGLGHDLMLMYEDETWSANSAFLLAAAADWMVLAAVETGELSDVTALSDLGDAARTAMSDHFWLDEGHYAPFIFRDGEEPERRPFEDVNLKPVWTGALTPDDPIALSNLQGLQAAAGHEDGTVQTPLDPQYHDVLGYPVEEGVCTGMVPGYYLVNLALLGDPTAELAFDSLHPYADSAGQYDEYMVYDDLSALAPIYDPIGGLGDYTARHRPWEGGINLDAFLLYLAGPLWMPGAEALLLRPHLPNGHRTIEIAHLVVGEAAGTVTTELSGGELRATFVSESAVPFDLQLDLPLPTGLDLAGETTVDGEGAGSLETMPAGERVVRFDALEVAPGATVVFSASIE